MPSGVGALTNSLSFLDLGGIREESAESNRNIFGQPCQQDQFLDASAGIELIACLLFTLYLFIFKVLGRCAIVMILQDCQGGCSVVLLEASHGVCEYAVNEITAESHTSRVVSRYRWGDSRGSLTRALCAQASMG